MDKCKSDKCNNLADGEYCEKCAKLHRSEWVHANTVLFPKLDDFPPDEVSKRQMGWFKMSPHDKYPTIVCGKCKSIGSMSDHKISKRGETNPSIRCANDKCDFHVWGVMLNWEEPHTLSEEALLGLASCGEPDLEAIAHEILTLRAKNVELEKLRRDPFCDMIAYACLIIGMQTDIAANFHIDETVVGAWGMGHRPSKEIVAIVEPYVLLQIKARQE